jgi:hypothetical protein
MLSILFINGAISPKSSARWSKTQMALGQPFIIMYARIDNRAGLYAADDKIQKHVFNVIFGSFPAVFILRKK